MSGPNVVMYGTGKKLMVANPRFFPGSNEEHPGGENPGEVYKNNYYPKLSPEEKEKQRKKAIAEEAAEKKEKSIKEKIDNIFILSVILVFSLFFFEII